MRASALLLAAALALVAAGACSCPGPACVLPPVSDPDAGVLVSGAHAHLVVRQPLNYNCTDTKVDSVVAEVFDEDNHPIAAATSVKKESDTAWAVTLDFDTTTPGWYHVSLRLEPSVSVIQFPILVARDRSDAPSLAVSGDCFTPQLTADLTPLCAGRPVLSANPEFIAQRAELVGNTVWVWDGSEVRRFEHRDGGFLAVPDAGYPVSTPVQLVAGVDGGEAFIFSSSTVRRLAARGDALVELASTPLGVTQTLNDGFATAETLFLTSEPSFASANSINSVCAYSLASDSITAPAACQKLTGIVLGYGDGALWLRDEKNARAFVPDGGALMSAGSVLLPPLNSSISTRTAAQLWAPLVVPNSGGWLNVRLVEGRLLYDRFSAEPGFSFQGATETTVAEHAFAPIRTRLLLLR